MRHFLLGVGLLLATCLAARAQSSSTTSSPAATLGVPRLSLGIPGPSANAPAPLQLTNHADPGPNVSPPILDPQAGVPLSPFHPVITSQPAPKMPVIQEGIGAPKEAPITNPPTATTFVDAETPLFGIADESSPFVRNDRIRFGAEYLAWWTKGYPTPPLLTTGPAANNGILGTPGVSLLYGNQNALSDFRDGVRFGGEYWFCCCPCWGIDSHVLFLTQTGQLTNFTSAGDPLLARPFFNANNGANSAELVAFPGMFSGAANISSTTSLWGGDFNLRRKLWGGSNTYIDGLIGYRFLSLTDNLAITESSTRLTPVVPVAGDPSSLVVSGAAFDRFRTSNQFNGGQLGTAMGFNVGRWTFDFRGLLGLGETSSSVDISGAQSVVRTDGTTAVSPGGLLALNSNVGHFYHEEFAIVPEFNFNVGYDICSHVRIFAGYSLLYWSSVLRPGDVINTNLDQNRIPNFPANPNVLTSPTPTPRLVDRDFLAQGFNAGLMIKW
jgi:Putative beta barrel porin-7 (BBP7)